MATKTGSSLSPFQPHRSRHTVDTPFKLNQTIYIYLFHFFKHPLSHPMRCTQWKHHWLHAVVVFHCHRNNKSCDHSSDHKPTTMVCTHLMSHDDIIIRIVMIRRFDCGSGGSFFNFRAQCSKWWCVQQDVEYTTAPRAVYLMHKCVWLVSCPDEQVVPSEVGSEACGWTDEFGLV